jgi:hypothetical protein
MARVVAASALESAGEPVRVAAGGVTGGAAGAAMTGAADEAGQSEPPGRPDRFVAVDKPAGVNTAAADETADVDESADVDETADVDHADNAPLLSFEVEGHGEVITRPRGWTSIRRSAALPVGALVPVSYDPQQPTRVALEGVPQSRSDLFWLLLGLAFTACGVTLLATAF